MKLTLDKHFPVYPVVDGEGRLLGTVRGHSLFEAQAVELTAQAGTMVGVDHEERLATRWPRSLMFRHPWLQLNLLTAFVAAGGRRLVRGHAREDRAARGLPAGARRPVGQHRMPGARGHAAGDDAGRTQARGHEHWR